MNGVPNLTLLTLHDSESPPEPTTRSISHPSLPCSMSLGITSIDSTAQVLFWICQWGAGGVRRLQGTAFLPLLPLPVSGVAASLCVSSSCQAAPFGQLQLSQATLAFSPHLHPSSLLDGNCFKTSSSQLPQHPLGALHPAIGTYMEFYSKY